MHRCTECRHLNCWRWRWRRFSRVGSSEGEGDDCGECSSEGAPATASTAAAPCRAPRMQTLNPAATLLLAQLQPQLPSHLPGGHWLQRPAAIPLAAVRL